MHTNNSYFGTVISSLCVASFAGMLFDPRHKMAFIPSSSDCMKCLKSSYGHTSMLSHAGIKPQLNVHWSFTPCQQLRLSLGENDVQDHLKVDIDVLFIAFH